MGRGSLDGETFGVKTGTVADKGIFGLKVGSYWPRNQSAGLAPHGSTILLLDPDTGRVRAVIEANQLNGPRTAAADAVAATVLARPDSQTLTIIGAGHQAEHEALALSAVLPLRRIFIVSRTAARAAALCEKLRPRCAAEVATTDVETGCRNADVLVTVTPSRAPLFEAEWLRPGTHVASMGSDQAGKQELPPQLLRRARLFCDLPAQSVAIGEFQHVRPEIQAGTVGLVAIGSVLAGRAPGRTTVEEVTVFDSSGLALQDLFVAEALLRAGDRRDVS
jgi:ornithine cyclodeaminase